MWPESYPPSREVTPVPPPCLRKIRKRMVVPGRPSSCAAMPVLPSPRRDLRRHLLSIHLHEMHLISIQVFD